MPRKVFVAGEILTAADVNTNLMDQAVMVFADSAARTTAIPTPSEGMVTYLSDVNRVEVFDGSSFVNVSPAQTGVLQVVSTALTSTLSVGVGATSFSANLTGLEATITPSSATSKVLVSVTINGTKGASVSSIAGRVMRDATAIGVGDAVGSRARLSFQTSVVLDDDAPSTAPYIFLDSPATTSAIIYGVQLYNPDTGSRTLQVNRSIDDNNNASFARTISTITVMEVAG